MFFCGTDIYLLKKKALILNILLSIMLVRRTILSVGESVYKKWIYYSRNFDKWIVYLDLSISRSFGQVLLNVTSFRYCYFLTDNTEMKSLHPSLIVTLYLNLFNIVYWFRKRTVCSPLFEVYLSNLKILFRFIVLYKGRTKINAYL